MSCDVPAWASPAGGFAAPAGWVAPTAGALDSQRLQNGINAAALQPNVALELAAPGGVYNGPCLSILDQQRTQPLRIRSSNGVPIDLSHCTGGWGASVYIGNSQRIIVEDILLDKLTSGDCCGGSNPVHVAGAASNGSEGVTQYVLLRRIQGRNLETGSGDTVKANQANWLWVLDSKAIYADNGTHGGRHGFDNVAVSHLAVCNNEVYAPRQEGVAIEAKGGSYDVLFERNYIRAARRGVVLGGERSNFDSVRYVHDPAFPESYSDDYEGMRQIARNNIIVDAREASLGFAGCVRCTAVGNTAWRTPAVPESGNRNFVFATGSCLEDPYLPQVNDQPPCYVRNGAPVKLRCEHNQIIDNLFGLASGGYIPVPVTLSTYPVGHYSSGGTAVAVHQTPTNFTVTSNQWWYGSAGATIPWDGVTDTAPTVADPGIPATPTTAAALTPNPVRRGVANEAMSNVDYGLATRNLTTPALGAWEGASTGGGGDAGTGTDSGSDTGGGSTCGGTTGLRDGNFESCQPNTQQVGAISGPWSVVSSGGSGTKVNVDYCTTSPCYYRSATHNAWAGCGFGGVQGIKQTVSGLAANTNYTFSFYARPSSNMTRHGQLLVKTTGGASLVGPKTFGASTGADFNLVADQYGSTPVSGTFCTGSNTAVDVFAQIDCNTAPAITSGGFEMDDFALVASGSCGGTPPVTATIAQATYEGLADSSALDVAGGTNASKPWKRVGCDWACYLEVPTPLNGQRSATVTCGDDDTTAGRRSLRQLVTGTANAGYTVSVSVRNSSGRGSLGFVRVTNTSGVELAAVNGLDHDETTPKSLTFTAPGNGQFYVEAGVNCSGYGNYDLTFDDWSITATP